MEFDGAKNADRFLGFAALYDRARPAMPRYPVSVIQTYLGRKPKIIVELGCGTGLSSLVWEKEDVSVIGIEPNDDMRKEAEKRSLPWLSLRNAFSHDTGLPDGVADAVVCSQSFHWMEPRSTLSEVGRLLIKGGVFATVDCDWPPVYNWKAERAYQELFDEVARLETTVPTLRQSFHRFEKSRHLENIKASGQFRFAREIVFQNTEPCTANRLIQLALSQGGLQSVLKSNPSLIQEQLHAFESTVKEQVGEGEISAVFSYRMRVGIK